MTQKLISLLFLFFILNSVSVGQNRNLDSLEKLYHQLPASKEISDDTTRIKLLNDISREYIKSGNHDRSIELADQARTLAEKGLSSSTKKTSNEVRFVFKKGIANSYHNSGTVYYYKGDYDKALELYLLSLKIREEIGDKLGVALSSNNIGNIYNNKGDYGKSLEYYFKSLKGREALGDKKGMAASFNNIGSLYESQKDNKKALDYFTRSLKIREEIGDKQGTALSLNNIGNVHYHNGDPDKALDHYTRSLEIRKEIGDKQGTADCYHNIGNIYQKNGSFEKGLSYHMMALKIREELGDRLKMGFSYRNIGLIHFENGNARLAKENLLKALELSKEVSAKPDMMSNYMSLAKVDSALGNFKGSYEYQKMFMQFKDSVHNEENAKKLVQSEMRYEFDKKEQAAKLEQEKKDALSKAALRQQTIQRNAFIAGFALMLALAGVSYKSYRNKRKAHEMIAMQKAIVEEKNKDILDSINYAKRIQDALLKEEEHVSPHLPEHFIYFKPKDIVSGDFYWVSEKHGHLYVAAVDCTGHGVPGAFMSMLGIAFLNEIVASNELPLPSEILDRLREKIIRELSQSSSDQESSMGSQVKDGMDISLMRLNLETNELLWSGANNPLYLIKKDSNEITEIKPDKQPIGYHSNPQPFKTHTLHLQKEDIIYLFTDGYADQFGGSKGKKFKYSQLKDLLLTNSSKPISKQKEIIDNTFVQWKGALEQVDDICVIGLKI